MRTILGSVLMVGAAFVVLGALFIFIGEQDDIGSGGYTALGALWYALLNLPILPSTCCRSRRSWARSWA